MMTSLLTLLALAADAGRPELVGRVVANDGAPVAGAHVLIESAHVRKGASPICPSCHLDCQKRAVTDNDGGFRITSLDPELTFDVLVLADGFRPTFANRFDPAKGPIKVALKPLDLKSMDPKRVIRGVVLDPGGKPLVGAKVTPQGYSTEAFSGFGGDVFDPLAVTNLRGEFVLTSRSPIESADLRVEGNGVAPRVVPGLRPETNPHTLRTTTGATLTGRLVRDGKPVAGASVGLVQVNRSAVQFLGDAAIGTGPDGRFTLPNVRADETYYLYGRMGTIAGGGAVAAREVRSGGEGSSTDVGDLPVVPGHRVRGRVLLSDEKPVPPDTRLTISREEAWDFVRVALEKDGRFEVSGLPTERYSLNVMIKGYRLSAKNHSADSDNPWQLAGTIDRDIDGLKILMEPGGR